MCAPYVLMRLCHLLNSSFVCKTKEGRHINKRIVLYFLLIFVSNSNQTCVIIYIWNVMIQVIFFADEWYPFSIGILKIILINTWLCLLLNSSFVCKMKEGRHILIWSKTIGPFYFEKQTELLLYMNLLIYKLYFGQLGLLKF
jgi:hypothetical protein